jgi:hypothetical protein
MRDRHFERPEEHPSEDFAGPDSLFSGPTKLEVWRRSRTRHALCPMIDPRADGGLSNTTEQLDLLSKAYYSSQPHDNDDGKK